MTSAPSHAMSCEAVGPAWTCVMSRMRAPESALSINFPVSSNESKKRHWVLFAGITLRFVVPAKALLRLRWPSRFLLRGGIETGDAASFGARLFVDDRVDQRRLARADRFFHRVAKLGRRRGQHTHATEGLHQFFVARALDEHQGGWIGSSGRIHFVAAVDAVVVQDHDADRQVVAADRLDFHAGETEGAVALDRDHLLAADHGRRDRKAPTEAHEAHRA